MWFYAVDGTPQGPVTVEQLVATLHGFSDPAAMHVWRDGMPAWQPAGSVPEVAARLLPPPVPLVAAPAPVPVAEVDENGETVAVVVAIATHYRWLVLLVGAQMFMGCALRVSGLGGPSVVGGLRALLVWSAVFALWTAMAVTVYRLMSLLKAGLPALWAMPMFVPVVNLLTLLVISQKMQAWCRKRRIYVGLLGPHKVSIDWIRQG